MNPTTPEPSRLEALRGKAAGGIRVGTDLITTLHPRNMPYGKEFPVRDPDGYIRGFVQSVAQAERS